MTSDAIVPKAEAGRASNPSIALAPLPPGHPAASKVSTNKGGAAVQAPGTKQRGTWRNSLCAGAAVTVLTLCTTSHAATLTVTGGATPATFETTALLSSPAAADIAVGEDPGYGEAPRHYRAVPVAALLAGIPLSPGDTIEATGTDGFITEIPASLLLQSGPDTARAWLAIEPPDAPWPPVAGETASAGPFYIVWERPQRSGVAREYWPFKLATLRLAATPEQRWPFLAVDASLPVDHSARVGQELFAANCLPCHRLGGAGASDMGPDLNRPMSPTEYFEPSALRRYIRDPGALRSWPQRMMQGFAPDQLSDYQIDAIVEYLDHMARRRAQAAGPGRTQP